MPFQRFHQDARQAVLHAQAAARDLGADQVGPEHLLLGLLDQPDGVACAVLTRHGLTRLSAYQMIQGLDAEALAAIGIDLAAVRDKLEAAFGAGVLDEPGPVRGRVGFSPAAKKVLELSLREAIHRKDDHIGDGHVLLALIREDGRAVEVLRAARIDPAALRDEVLTALSR
ncbi:MAG: Clp protease [Hamadaea sp.]|uniref:Clp protease N-terminal domain-containing protein n=1 Tax=Hamadaea sp. TaxID=2024425 RepID=UPI0017BD4DF6|nr:Clp protease N-terminal domain-containing protein [Hamadaea sp.]NUR73198.1 Clp protease [Hamadaea sp.]NUT23042.1 Clp protease [Hamadaea sp.]